MRIKSGGLSNECFQYSVLILLTWAKRVMSYSDESIIEYTSLVLHRPNQHFIHQSDCSSPPQEEKNELASDKIYAVMPRNRVCLFPIRSPTSLLPTINIA
jgi:hypothetical protein